MGPKHLNQGTSIGFTKKFIHKYLHQYFYNNNDKNIALLNKYTNTKSHNNDGTILYHNDILMSYFIKILNKSNNTSTNYNKYIIAEINKKMTCNVQFTNQIYCIKKRYTQHDITRHPDSKKDTIYRNTLRTNKHSLKY